MSVDSISKEDQDQYNQLEKQRSTSKGRLIQLQSTLLGNKKNKKKNELTLQELNNIKQNDNNTNQVRTFQAVGRMYVIYAVNNNYNITWHSDLY